MENIEQVFLRIEKGCEKIVEEKVARAVTKLYNEIVDRTPVDTGNLRKNWEINFGVGYVNPGLNFEAKGSVKVDLKQDNEITIRNQAPYAYYIEYGKIGGNMYSRQAPSGMMRVSAKNFGNHLK